MDKQKVDLIISGEHLFSMAGTGVGYRKNWALAVLEGKIIQAGPEHEITAFFKADKELAGGSRYAIFPGFIDAHAHFHLALLRGLAQDTSSWMMQGIAPYQRVLDSFAEEERCASVALGLLEAIRNGTTTVCEYGEASDAVCTLFMEAGVRLVNTCLIREVEFRVRPKGELYDFDPLMGEKSLARSLEIADAWNNVQEGLITVALGPLGPDFLSPELLGEVVTEARKRGLRYHMHLSQGARETEQMMLRWGKSSVFMMDSWGYLQEDFVAIHLTDATEEEAALVARSGASMILCSGSIGIIDGIVPPAMAFQEARGFVGLGSDQAPGNNCHNMINEMKLTALFNKIHSSNPEVMPAWKALRMATIEGARALGISHLVGSLEEGKRADCIFVDLWGPSMCPVYTDPVRNMVPNLVYAARGNEIDTVVVDGKVVLSHGEVKTLQRENILENARNLGEKIQKRTPAVSLGENHVGLKMTNKGCW